MFGWSKRRQEIGELFTRHVRPELAEAMKSPTFNPALNELSTVRVNFIAIAVQGESPSDVGRKLGLIADAARAAGWYADYLFSNLAVLVDGPPLPKAAPRSKRLDLLAALQQTLGATVKSVHGEVDAPWGNYGSAGRITFGAMLPDFLEVVAALHAQPYGSHVAR